MNEALKQKIVGIVVVTAALAVFLPSLFDEPIQEELLSHTNVSKQPADLTIEDFVTIERERVFDAARQNIETVRGDDEKQVQLPAVASQEAAGDNTQLSGTQLSGTQLSGTQLSGTQSSAVQKIEGAGEGVQTTELIPSPADKTTTQPPAAVLQKNLPSAEIAQLREAVDTLMDKVTGAASQKTENKIPPQAEPVVGSAWAIQLASFSEQGNAVKLRDTLLSQGEKSYLRRSDVPAGKTIYRVYVGPMLKDSDANAALERLKVKHALKGILVKYMPE